MTSAPLPPPGWYPDPAMPGAQRWFDGRMWTPFAMPLAVPTPMPAPTPAPMPVAPWLPTVPSWKGARYGLPAAGPGSLASPGRRLGARVLDALVLFPVFGLTFGVTLAIAAPRFGPMFPTVTAIRTRPQPAPTPGIFWVYLTAVGALVVAGMVMVAYESVMTATRGRTLGKAWLGIRPVRTDGTPLGWGRSFARVALYWLSGFLSWLGLLDPLWCVWDADNQCLHDKVVGTVVVHDPEVTTHPTKDLRTATTALGAR